MSRRTIMVFGIVVVFVAAATALVVLRSGEEPLDITLETVDGTDGSATTANEPIRIAVSAMTSPKETFTYYQQILDYISEKTGRPVQLVQRETYQEVNDLIDRGELDMAFVCTGAYVEGHEKFGMEILAAPVAYGEPSYYSLIIVPADSDTVSLEDLRGKDFAFTDPMSNTGRLVPVYMLGQMGETSAAFFSKTIFTYSHDRSIQAVAEGIVDGAAVDSLVYDYMAATGDPCIARTRVIRKSPPYGIPPVVVPQGLDPALKEELREILLAMDTDPKGAMILEHIKIDRFQLIDDEAYDSVREMQTWIDANVPGQ
ncbi:MAG: phosphate/phosphite/phosphonate ABC transporter substrate-binding protein [Coriobacteriia bacterium]|nr:phosphate/phosphite/phosphonate ABC transporter substrate-binding protein [Coriobacteriia bacterium]